MNNINKYYVTISSINVNGLRDSKKREKIMNWLNSQHIDVICLQETHCTTSEQNTWSKQWKDLTKGGESIWCNGTSSSKGVAILWKNNRTIKLVETGNGQNGRYIAATIEIDDKIINLFNIYAPNNGVERRHFFNMMRNIITINNQNSTESIIIGDFNCTVDNTCDRKPEQNKSDIGLEELANLIQNNNLEDIWRSHYDKNKKFTFKRGQSESRIDNIFTPVVHNHMFSDSKIKYCPYSDHNLVSVKFLPRDIERGPGIWKMSNKVIEHEIFSQTFENYWQNLTSTIYKYNNILDWWEITKVRIKEFTIEIGRYINTKDKPIKEMENKLEKMLEENTRSKEEIQHIQTKIKEHYDNKTNAARVRSRIQNFEENEKSTAYFFNLEKQKAQNKQWYRIKTVEGNFKYGIRNILNEQTKFYEKLFQTEGWNKNCAENLTQHIENKISDEEKLKTDREIEDEEIINAVKSLKNNKSPGEDGIISEFYKKYWHIIGAVFLKMIRYVFEKSTLSNSQGKGILKLLFKKGEREDIKNWRPLTMLNTDYKVIAKVISNRIKPLLPRIIHTDQKGFVAGRNIMDANRELQDIIDYCDMEEEKGAIIFIDQQKAFDRIEWGWVFHCFKQFNFGDKYCNWVKMLVNNAKTCIETNGFISKYFKLSRSARQGCPMAPIIYILQAEPLACSIRANYEIKGIKLPNTASSEVKLNGFADDLQHIHRTEESIKQSFETLKIYEKASGSKINYEKTEAIYLGSWKNKTPIFTEIKWTKNAVKTLGIYHGYNVNIDKIWREKIQKIKNCIHVWKTRNLTHDGKVLVIRSQILSIASFEIEARGIPEKYKKEINQLIWNFIWDGKINLVNRKTCCNSKNKGGINMVELDVFIQSKYVKTLYRVLHSETDHWNAFGKYLLQKFDRTHNMKYFICSCSHLDGLNLNITSKFYQQCVKAWINFRAKIPVNSKNEVLNQSLFKNIIFQIRGKSLCFISFLNSNLTKVKDIWCEDRKDFIESATLLRKLTNKTNWISEFANIKISIAPKYKQILKDEISKESEVFINSDLQIVCRNSTIKKEITYSSKSLKEKIIQKILMPDCRPNAELKWEEQFQNRFDSKNWEIVWTKTKNMAVTQKMKQFEWKLTHRILFTEAKLQVMNRSDGKCHFCAEVESLTHLFYNCNYVQQFFSYVEQNIADHVPWKPKLISIIRNKKEYLIGNIDDDNCFFNAITINMKYTIWKVRNIIKFQNKVINVNSAFVILKEMLRSNIQTFLRTGKATNIDFYKSLLSSL